MALSPILWYTQESPSVTTRSRSLLTVKGQITSEKLDEPIEIREIALWTIHELLLFHYTLTLKT